MPDIVLHTLCVAERLLAESTRRLLHTVARGLMDISCFNDCSRLRVAITAKEWRVDIDSFDRTLNAILFYVIHRALYIMTRLVQRIQSHFSL